MSARAIATDRADSPAIALCFAAVLGRKIGQLKNEVAAETGKAALLKDQINTLTAMLIDLEGVFRKQTPATRGANVIKSRDVPDRSN